MGAFGWHDAYAEAVAHAGSGGTLTVWFIFTSLHVLCKYNRVGPPNKKQFMAVKLIRSFVLTANHKSKTGH